MKLHSGQKKVLKLVLLIVVFIWHGDIFDLKLGVPEIAQEKNDRIFRSK